MISPEELVRDSVSERADLEFKRDLPKGSQKDKAELLKDVSAIANGGGGIIYYGVDERDGMAYRLCPIESSSVEVDTRRIAQVLESGIEPRLNGLVFHDLPVEGGSVIALEIPPSLSGPCRRVQDGQSKFFIRNHTHISEMSYEQIRRYFQRSAEAMAFARNKWRETLEKVKAGRTWRPMIEGPVCMAQLVPLSAAYTPVSVDVKSIRNQHHWFMQPDWGGCSGRFNLDGVVYYPGLYDDRATVLVQVYRNGIVESYRTGKALWSENENIIPSQTIAEFYRNSYRSFSKFIIDQGISGPFIFNCAISGVGGFRLALERGYFFFEELVADRDELVFPEVYFDAAPDPNDEMPIKEILDILWQSF